MIRHVLALLALVLLVVAGCSKSLSQLAPFPCAKDGTCPDGYDCTSARQCVVRASCAGGEDCSGTCVDLTTDERNCGACGAACLAGQSCCGSACTDTTTSTTNCGSCGRACGGALTCLQGQCGCAGGLTACGTSCADVESDAANCGTCGASCGTHGVCSGGVCGCAPGYTQCGSACVDLTTDASNCGACGAACKLNGVCSASACVCPSTFPDVCGNACVNTATDANNCGACRATCTGGKVCASGACACPSGETVCNGTCVNEQTSATSCGSCGNACPTGASCTQGVCCGARPFGGTCSVAPACGCEVDGGAPKCAPAGTGGAEECIANGNVAMGGVCTTDMQCGPATLCTDGICAPVCSDVSQCTGTNWACDPIYVGGTPGGFGNCAPHCNPLTPHTSDATHATCAAGQTCRPSSLTKGVTVCVPSTGSSTQGETCENDTDCTGGYACAFFGDASTGECLPWCPVGAVSTGCPNPSTCTAFGNSLISYDDATELGVCVP